MRISDWSSDVCSSDLVEDAIVFAIVEKATGRAVGTCGLYLINWICRRAQFNILIGEPEVWDKGYGSEAARLILGYAFDKLNLESVQLGVNAENKRAIRSYEKAGFVQEEIGSASCRERVCQYV